MNDAKIRLYVEHSLGQGQSIALSREHAHYLFGVMRLSVGAAILLFNGTEDGEWRAEVIVAGKRNGIVKCTLQTQKLQLPPNLWLMFAPIKKSRTDFIVEKATEMGVSCILPVQTDFTNAKRIQLDRLQAHAVEAAEQCGGTFVPRVLGMQPFDKALAELGDRQLLFCDEKMVGEKPVMRKTPGPWAILIGPEGGFSKRERDHLSSLKQSCTISLGPRILRADTAAVAALTIWQMTLGDW